MMCHIYPYVRHSSPLINHFIWGVWDFLYFPMIFIWFLHWRSQPHPATRSSSQCPPPRCCAPWAAARLCPWRATARALGQLGHGHGDLLLKMGSWFYFFFMISLWWLNVINMGLLVFMIFFWWLESGFQSFTKKKIEMLMRIPFGNPPWCAGKSTVYRIFLRFCIPIWLGWFGTLILWLSIQLGMSSSPLTNSIIFQ